MRKYFVLIAGNNETFCSLEDALNDGWRIERADNAKKTTRYVYGRVYGWRSINLRHPL